MPTVTEDLKSSRPIGAKSLLATLSLAAAGSLWGTGFLFGKIAFTQMTVSENVAFRFLVGGLCLSPILFRRAKRFASRDLWLLAFAGLVGVPVQFLVQFKGLQLTTVSHASLMVGTLPMLLALSSALFLHERLKWREWGVLSLSAVGAILIALSSSRAGHAASTARGDLLVLVSMIAAVVMILTTKRLMAEYDPLQVTGAMIIMGTALLLVWVEVTQPVRFHFSAKAWLAVVAQGVLATTMAYVLWNWGLARVPAARAGVFLNMEPLIGAILGLTFLHESLGPLAILGGAMIIGSAAYFSTRAHAQSGD